MGGLEMLVITDEYEEVGTEAGGGEQTGPEKVGSTVLDELGGLWALGDGNLPVPSG